MDNVMSPQARQQGSHILEPTHPLLKEAATNFTFPADISGPQGFLSCGMRGLSILKWLRSANSLLCTDVLFFVSKFLDSDFDGMCEETDVECKLSDPWLTSRMLTPQGSQDEDGRDFFKLCNIFIQSLKTQWIKYILVISIFTLPSNSLQSLPMKFLML